MDLSQNTQVDLLYLNFLVPTYLQKYVEKFLKKLDHFLDLKILLYRILKKQFQILVQKN